ncbi:hypothetical protein ACP70R_032393 [Stipagrostis hirtigluma subsp. patula]
MAEESCSRRRSPGDTTRDCSRAGGGTRANAISDISDDLLELVLLHIGSPVSLIRAAATCKPWRRVIGGAGFLRRFRSIHGPHVLGHYFQLTDFSFFFPSPGAAVDVRAGVPSNLQYHAVLNDSRHGLLTFVRTNCGVIVVSNPFTRQRRELHPPCRRACCHSRCLTAFLLDADADEPGRSSHMSNFRVLCVSLPHLCHGSSSSIVEAHVFSARDNRWLSLSTMAVDDVVPPGADMYDPTHFMFVGRAGGLICWSAKVNINGVLLLDESTGEFSSFTLPGRLADINRLRMIGVDAGVMRLVRTVRDDFEVLRYARSSGDCVIERRVGLSQLAGGLEARPDRWWRLMEMAEAAGTAVHFVLSPGDKTNWVFTVDVENMKLERTQSDRFARRVFTYELPWPPTIKACL